MQRRCGWVMSAVLVFGVTAAVAAPKKQAEAVPEIRVEGDGLQQTVKCTGGVLRVLASRSRLTIEGTCTTVSIEGSHNWMEVQDADKIVTVGDMNSVLFLNPATRYVDRGRGNSVTPKWQQ